MRITVSRRMLVSRSNAASESARRPASTKAIVRGSGRVTILPMQVASAELSIGVLRAISIRESVFPRSIGVRRMAGGRLTRLGEALLETLIHSSSL